MGFQRPGTGAILTRGNLAMQNYRSNGARFEWRKREFITIKNPARAMPGGVFDVAVSSPECLGHHL